MGDIVETFFSASICMWVHVHKCVFARGPGNKSFNVEIGNSELKPHLAYIP